MTPDFADAQVWLQYAEEDLTAAAALLAVPAVVPRHPAWLAQQAAEKAIKAALVADGRPFPKTHDLERLEGLLPDPSPLAACGADLPSLTEYAVGSRYPGDLPDDVSADDARTAVDDAGKVVDAIRELIEGGRQDG